MREQKDYNGDLMKKGQSNEQTVMIWMAEEFNSHVVDVRDRKEFQQDEIDFLLSSTKGLVTIEVKSDKWINEEGNFLFEDHRINHHVAPYHYLGWGWRSKADVLVVRNPNTGETFTFDFDKLRKAIGIYVKENGRNVKQSIVETDEQKTTFNMLIPMKALKHVYTKHV